MTTCDGHCGAEVNRDRWGRPVIKGTPYTRVSTVAKTLSDQGNLIEWQARMMLRYATRADATDVLEAVRLADGDTEAEKRAYAVAKERAGLDAAARRGTNLHAVVGLSVRGLPLPELDANTIASLTAFWDYMNEHHLTPVLSEQFVVFPTYMVAGTFDLTITNGEEVFMADIKTGASQWDRYKPHAVAVQMAAYQGGVRWCPQHGPLDPHGANPRVGLLVSLPVDTGTCHVDEIDLEAGRRGLELALEVREWRGRRNLIRA